MQVRLKDWWAFKDHFAQYYRRYHIRKKKNVAEYGYGASENHTHETDTQVMNVGALQALKIATMEDKE